MNLKLLPLPKIHLNHHNDRHGELGNEDEAIRWLLKNREQHMKNLTKDIVAQGRLYEPPLVRPSGDNYVVFDGNRRTTCIKLLSDPNRAPSDFNEFFIAQRRLWTGAFPTQITCQIELDDDTIDEILFRRHTGAQSGVGQSHWDDLAKDNFISRTGRRDGANIAEDIERKLVEEGFIETIGSVPRTNLKRLLSAEEFRNAFGISLSKGQLYFLHKPDEALKALSRVADDLKTKRLVLGDLWNNNGKRHYIDDLRKSDLLPTDGKKLDVPIPFAQGKSSQNREANKPAQSSAAVKGRRRDNLIPRDIRYQVSWTPKTTRHRDIWNELQTQLFLDRHLNAISVTFRVLLEISIDHCIAEGNICSVHPNDQLAKKVEKVAQYLTDRKQMDEKYRRDVMKFAHSEAIISTNTMHRYVHSPNFSPSPQHLTAIWDTLSRFLVLCLAANHPASAAA